MRMQASRGEGSPEAGATSSDGPRSRVHMIVRGQTAPILQLSILYRMHRLPTLCGLILASALLIWGKLGAHCPKMVRGIGKKVMGIDSPYGELLACANAVGVSLEIGELLVDKV